MIEQYFTLLKAMKAEEMMPSSGALFSSDRVYRYALWRPTGGGNGKIVGFIGLNPSTADEVNNDPTVRRCIGFAQRWGYSAMYMLNIFGYRSTDPRGLKDIDDPVGPGNDEAISVFANRCEKIVSCWGVHGEYLGRGRRVMEILYPANNVYSLGVTKSGHPKHPLYLRGDTDPMLYSAESLDAVGEVQERA